MINLDKSRINDCIVMFENEMLNKVIDRIEKSFGDSKTINPFTGKPILNFFGSSQVERRKMISDLLTIPIKEVTKKYEQVDAYMRTSLLVTQSIGEIKDKISTLRDKSKLSYSELIKKVIQAELTSHINGNEWLRFDTSIIYSSVTTIKSFNELIKLIKIKIETFNEEISKVFQYNTKTMTADFRHELLFKFGIEVCPYCNRNYISNYTEIKNGKLKNKVTSDLDHFFSKHRYPLFSLSLYNFIPSCQICNLRFKGQNQSPIIHPFLDEIDYSKLKFSMHLNPDSNLGVFTGSSNDFEIRLITTDSKYKNNIQIFKLEEMYSYHKSTVSEIMFKKIAYSNSYMDMIDNLFDSLNINNPAEKEIFLYGIEMNPSKFYKKPLSKLIYDIVKE